MYKVFSELTIISFLPWQCCLIDSTPELNLNYKNQRTSLYGTSVGQNSQGSIAESSTPRSMSSHRMNVSIKEIIYKYNAMKCMYILYINVFYLIIFLDVSSTSREACCDKSCWDSK